MSYSIFVGIALNQGIFTESPSWTDVSNDLRELKTVRGRLHELDRVEAGTAVLKMENTPGHWWRYNPLSPFYPYLKPLTLMKVTATYNSIEYPIFYGYIESMTPGWESDRGGKGSFVTVQLVDVFKSFARMTVLGTAQTPVGTFPVQLSSDRVNAVLDELGWPVGLRSIDTGKVYVRSLVVPTGGTNAMTHLYEVNEAEGGNLFIGADGKVYFQDRDARTRVPLSTSQATFTDSGDSHYVLPDMVDDDTFLYNECRIKGAGAEQVYYDAAAIALQGERAIVRTSSQIQYDPDAYFQAYSLVNKYVKSFLRCNSLLVMPDDNASDLYPKVFGFEISTRITLQLNSTDNPAQVNMSYHIEGIDHEWHADTNLWQTKYQNWDPSSFQSFYANHADYITAIDNNYTTAHNAASGTALNDPTNLSIGQVGGGSYAFTIDRGFCTFDTSSLIGVNILSADLLLYDTTGAGSLPLLPFVLEIVDPSTVTHPTSGTNYHDLLASVTSWGSIAVDNTNTTWIKGGWNKIHLNATGIAGITQGSTTKFALRASTDISATPPSQPPDPPFGNYSEMVQIGGVGTAYKPILIIGYDNTTGSMAIVQNVYLAGGARAFNTVYSNLTAGVTIRVTVSINITADGDLATARVHTNNPPTVIRAETYGSTVAPGNCQTLSFIVPYGNYYEIVTTGTPTIAYWSEWVETLS